MSFTTGNTPSSADSPTSSLQKINSILLSPSIPGFSIPAFDSVSLTYYGSTNNVHTVGYLLGATTLATLTLSYVGGTPSTDDAALSGVVKS